MIWAQLLSKELSSEGCGPKGLFQGHTMLAVNHSGYLAFQTRIPMRDGRSMGLRLKVDLQTTGNHNDGQEIRVKI